MVVGVGRSFTLATLEAIANDGDYDDGRFVGRRGKTAEANRESSDRLFQVDSGLG